MDVSSCLMPQCGKSPHVRGLCPDCYDAVRRIIKVGAFTEAELIGKNMILLSKTPGRRKLAHLSDEEFADHLNKYEGIHGVPKTVFEVMECVRGIKLTPHQRSLVDKFIVEMKKRNEGSLCIGNSIPLDQLHKEY